MQLSRLLVLTAIVFTSIAIAQPRDPGLTSYLETDPNGGPNKVLWQIEPLKSVTSVPEDWVNTQQLWSELSVSELRDKDAVSRVAILFAKYEVTNETWVGVPKRIDVVQWYNDLAQLNSRATNGIADILKYNEANANYKNDKANYEATTSTQDNYAYLTAWYQRLMAEHARITEWFDRIERDKAGQAETARGLDQRSKGMNISLDDDADKLNKQYSALWSAIHNEYDILQANIEIETVRKKIQQTNEKLREISKITATVKEAEDWAALAETQREKGQWDALLSLASVSVTQISNKYTVIEKVTREELRTVKQHLLYKYKLKPEVVKKIMKNWIDDGKLIPPIKTKRELFEQLGTLVTVADSADKSSRAEYLEALAGCLSVFVKTPALNLLVTDIQIYLSLFDTGFTYYHANQRVTQLLKLSEDQLKAVKSLAELNKKTVNDELIPLKKSVAELIAKRNY